MPNGLDIDAIRKLYLADGPFVSIYLDSTSDVENAAPRFDLEWKNLLRDLEERGVDTATREAISAARGTHDLGGTRVIFAAGGSVQLAGSLPQPPSAATVTIGPLPHVLPLLDALTLAVPHVVVLLDRAGADVLAYAGGGPRPVQSGTIEGPEHGHLHKVSVGAWSSQGNQQSTEAEWQHNAEEVAAKVVGVVADVGAQLLLVAGDQRMINYFRPALPERLQPIVRELPGSRARDGGDDELATRVLDEVGRAVMDRTVELLERFAQERGQRDQAAEGLTDTVEALRRAQVGTLLLTDGLDDAAALWIGAEPSLVAVGRDELTDLGVDDPQQAPAVDVLPWAALATGADVRVVTGSVEQAPREGVGALLRYRAS